MFLNCGIGEDSWESLGLWGDPIGRIDVEAETPILWPPDAKSWLIGRDPDAGKDWGQEKKGTTEDEMIGWPHWLNGHGFGWTLGVGDRETWRASVRGVAKSEVGHNWATELNNFNIFFFYSVLRMKSLNFLSNWNPFKIWNLFFKKPIRRKCIIPEINRKTWFHLVKKSNRSLLLSKKVKSILET